eukprot:COSAG03_NODE_6142_length_1107_cov_147.607143_2_plen_169_part_00
MRLTFTRARVFQLQTDVLSVATVVWDLRQRLFLGGSGGQLSHLRAELDELCGLLLRSAAVLTAPLQTVLDWLDRYRASRGKAQEPVAAGREETETERETERETDREAERQSPWAELPWLSYAIAVTGPPQRSEFDPVLEMGKLTSGGDPGEAWNLVSFSLCLCVSVSL